MISDPGQEQDLAQQQTELVAEFDAAYAQWFEDVTSEGFETIPISVGFSERPEVILPGHEAFLYPSKGEGISYHREAGYANDWIDNWWGTESYPFWELDIVKQGVYEVTLMYVCSPEDVGSRVRVEVGDRHVDGVVSEAHDPDPIPSPDYVPRGEVYEKVWAPLTLGSLELPQGRTRLKVRALDLEGQEVMELKSVILRLQEPEVGR
jgi:hypothetical protein